jgi:DNA-binding NarL/FixJ family response regulator
MKLQSARSVAVTTIFIADDSDHVRRAIRNFFASDSRFKVIGEARNYSETLRMIIELKPDLLLVDLRMPGADPDAAGLAKLISTCKCPAVVMSFSADAETRGIASSVGASRLVDKTKLYQELIPAIEEVLAEHRAKNKNKDEATEVASR